MTANTQDRPVNEDGTTNWQVVFDDLDKGILAAVQAVTSVAQMQALMQTIAKLLFKRRHDADTRIAFLDEIDEIISGHGDDLEFIRADILVRLCKERDQRIRKAEQYSQNKAISQSLERRRSGVSTGILQKPGTKVLLAMVLLVIIAGGIFAVLDMDSGNGDSASKTEQKSEPAPAPVEKTPTPPKPAEGPPPPVIKMLAMKPMPLGVVISGQERRQAYVPLMELNEDADINSLCALAPWIIEAVTLHVHSLTAAGREATPANMQKVADAVRRDINARDKTKLPPFQLLNTKTLPRGVVSTAYAGCAQVEIEQNP